MLFTDAVSCGIAITHRRATVSYTHLKDDLERRDFTMNALAYNPRTGVVDFVGGKADIAGDLVRCVGDPDQGLGRGDRRRGAGPCSAVHHRGRGALGHGFHHYGEFYGQGDFVFTTFLLCPRNMYNKMNFVALQAKSH